MRSSASTRAEVIEYAAELLVESWDRGRLVPDDVEALRAALALKVEPPVATPAMVAKAAAEIREQWATEKPR